MSPKPGERRQNPSPPGTVATWHLLSGLPDNVTDEGVIVDAEEARRLQTEKRLLRAAIDDVNAASAPDRARAMAKLAASYLVAGDVETARRYLGQAHDLASAGEEQPP